MVKNEEHEEMVKKIKILEHSIRDVQGLWGHKGISMSELCMFPQFHLPARFKSQCLRNTMVMDSP